MQQSLERLIALLDLEEIDVNHYRGKSPNEGWQRVYGGQVIGQALVAASRTVDPDRPAHSLHGYFLRPGDTSVPILYVVDRIRDGKSFTTRRVVAVQHGKAIFNMAISFQTVEAGLAHQFDMPDVPPPDDLEDEISLRKRWSKNLPPEYRDAFTRERPIEVRPINPYNFFDPIKSAPFYNCWMRARDALPDDRRLHQCVLAYLSDWALLDTSLIPHGISYMQQNVQSASLDHAMWFHREFRADDWLLFVQDSPSAAGARGFNRGLIYRRDGALVASVAQEGLIRLHGHPSASL